MENIRDKICNIRRNRIEAEGWTMGHSVPETREIPVVPFGRDPFVICEVKRRSPSKGNINAGLDAVTQASLYAEKGIKSVSVLTEEDHFGGSLKDLMDIKKACPDVAVLRKDFLLELEDIDISYRAGADAVLLIAACLSGEKMKSMYDKAKSLGMEVLVEVHNDEDIDKVRGFKPDLTGINCRDLSTFKTDLTIPLRVRQSIDWTTNIVFESGIHRKEDAQFAFKSGFAGILVGESVVKNPNLIPRLIDASGEKQDSCFWSKLYDRKKAGQPLVKVCGITNREDAEIARDLGADVIGFVCAHSPRRADISSMRKMADLDILKVGVVVLGGDVERLNKEMSDLVQEGILDAIQFHGHEMPVNCASISWPYYKAIRLRSKADVSRIGDFYSPRVLVDAFSDKVYGGTGKLIQADIVSEVNKSYPLWIAGGLSPDNVGQIVRDFSPELIDASSGLEKEPGKKDKDKLEKYFREIKNACV